MAKKRWNDLSERNRKLIVAAAVGELLLKAAALADLKRRPAAEIRGSKRAWATAVTLVNALGAAPLIYFFFGRRKPTDG